MYVAVRPKYVQHPELAAELVGRGQRADPGQPCNLKLVWEEPCAAERAPGGSRPAAAGAR